MINKRFMELLVINKVLTVDDARKLFDKYKEDTYAVLDYLVKGGVGKKDMLGKLWGDSIGVSYVDLDKTLIQGDSVRKLPEKFARANKIIPLYQFGESITVATPDPLALLVIQEASRLAGVHISPVFSYREDIDDAIEIHYQSDNVLNDFVNRIAENALFKGTSKITDDQIRKISGDQGVVELVRGMLLLAVKERASDIHLEPGEDFVRVRFRIDGVLHERLKIEHILLLPLVSRLKILANMDIVEKRRPQDGRISLPLTNRSIDYRLSTVPTIYGEKVVLRVLGQIKTRETPDIAELNFSSVNLLHLRKVVESPNGVFFVTGPTGSGKTTTLYAVLKHLNKPGINIMTIEDPVEYRLAGINQIQVNHSIDLDFASALRSFLRQDPDVILVGEIRDAETAKIASQAALTGHLVLTTMHTNNALQAVTRLVEIGVEPFLVAPSIIGIMAQRLVRKICDHCKEKYALTSEQIEELFVWDGKREVSLYRGRGCEACGHTGFSGRIAIHELFIINDVIRKMIAKDASIIDIQEEARKSGFKTMHYDGIKKVLRGITTIEEVNRVTYNDDVS